MVGKVTLLCKMILSEGPGNIFHFTDKLPNDVDGNTKLLLLCFQT